MSPQIHTDYVVQVGLMKKSLHTNVQVTLFGSRPSDHYFRTVCLFVCAEFFSAVFDPLSIKLGHMLYVCV